MQVESITLIHTTASDKFSRRIAGYIARFAARKQARDLALDGLLVALDVLRRQRGVAIAIEAPAEHLAELDAEEAAYLARARELGAAWA